MRSLLYKDIVNLKQQFRFYLIILAFYVLLGIKSGDASFLGAIMTIFAVMLSVTACAYDEKAGWDKYAAHYAVRRSGADRIEVSAGADRCVSDSRHNAAGESVCRDALTGSAGAHGIMDRDRVVLHRSDPAGDLPLRRGERQDHDDCDRISSDGGIVVP